MLLTAVRVWSDVVFAQAFIQTMEMTHGLALYFAFLHAEAMAGSESDGSVSPAHSVGSVQSDFLGELKNNVDADAAKMPPPPAPAPGSPAHSKIATGTLGMFKCCSDVYVVLWCRASV